jgi:large subunit ribosomal protein L24
MSGLQSKLKKGDEVIVITGKAKGLSGKISQVMTEKNRVIVAGLLMAKKHLTARKAAATQQEPGIVQKEMSIHASNVMLKDPKSGKVTKIAYKITADGAKQRVAKKSGDVIDTIKKAKGAKPAAKSAAKSK